jgi:hypothetical protein
MRLAFLMASRLFVGAMPKVFQQFFIGVHR